MKEELKEYGLSDKEIEVYLACLKNNNLTTNKISEVTKIRRSTVYEILESLKRKGLMTSVKKNKKSFFSSAEPEKLIFILKEKEALMNKIIPNLNNLKQPENKKISVEMYEGRTGIMNACLEMLDCKELLGYGGNGWIDDIFNIFTKNFSKKRVENNVFLKAIIEEKVPKHMMTKDVLKYTKIKTLKPFKNMQNDFFIYNDYVLILILGKEPSAIKIRSEEFASAQRIIFSQLWNLAK